MAAGLDSLSSVELRNSLEAKLGTELPTTLVFDFPTMAAMAGYLASKIQPDAGITGGAGSGTNLTDSEAEYEPVAVPAAAVARRRRRSSAPSRQQRSQAAATAAAAATGGGAAAGVSAEAHRAFMLEQVQEAVAAVLGRADIDAQEPLMAAGLDSLSSVELRNSLEAKLGAELPTTLVFDYPTVAALAGFLASRIQPGGAGAELAAADNSASDSESYCSEASYSWDEEDLPASLALPRQRSRQVVAVTGMAVRAPGDAFAGIQPVDAVQMVPASRWNLEAHGGVLVLIQCACWELGHACTMPCLLCWPPRVPTNAPLRHSPFPLQTCLAACRCALAASCQPPTSLMPPPLQPRMPKRC
jgi:acyl carrier protein